MQQNDLTQYIIYHEISSIFKYYYSHRIERFLNKIVILFTAFLLLVSCEKESKKSSNTGDKNIWKYKTSTLVFELDTTLAFSDQVKTVMEFHTSVNKEIENCYDRAANFDISENERDSLTARVFSLSMLDSFLKFIAFEEMSPDFCDDARRAMTQRYTSSPEEEFEKLPAECQNVYHILEIMCNNSQSTK